MRAWAASLHPGWEAIHACWCNGAVAFASQVYIREGKAFPEQPMDQLRNAIYAVFDSWNSDRAKTYRAVQQIVGLR